MCLILFLIRRTKGRGLRCNINKMYQIKNLAFLATSLAVAVASVNDACNGRCDNDKTTFCNVGPKVCESCSIYCDPSSLFGSKDNCNTYCPYEEFPTTYTPTAEVDSVTESVNHTITTTRGYVKVTPKSKDNKTLTIVLCLGTSGLVAVVCLMLYQFCKLYCIKTISLPVQESIPFSIEATTDNKEPIAVTAV